MSQTKVLILEDEKLMSEWDWEENNKKGLFPDKLTCLSNKQACWVCEKGHKWKTEIYHRTKGNGCPICSNHKILIGFNDLETTHPQIAKEWDYAKNRPRTPKQVVSGSAKKFWWVCTFCGETFEASIRKKVSGGIGCVKCRQEKRKQEKRYIEKSPNLKEKYPKIAKEWDYEKNGELRPEYCSPTKNEKVGWICSVCGFRWNAKISNRTQLNRGCPCCSNQKVVSGKNDLATRNPELAKEWHPSKNGELLPSMVMPGSRQKVWWLCPKGHEYQASLLHRNHGTGCPTCNEGRQTSFAEKAIYYYIKQIYPDAIHRAKDLLGKRMELDIYIPSIKFAIEYDGSFWHKSEKSKERDERKFELCKEKGIRLLRVVEAEGSLESWDSNYALFVDPSGKNKNLDEVIQRLIDELDPRSSKFARNNFPYMIGSPLRVSTKRDRYKIIGEMTERNEWIKDYPDLLKEWHPTKNEGRTPGMFSIGSGEKVFWKCSRCGHEWKASIYQRTKGNTGCEKCQRERNRGVGHASAKKVYQYTLEGKFVKEWGCISDVRRELSINSSNISMCAKGQRNSAGGYKWTYEEKREG